MESVTQCLDSFSYLDTFISGSIKAISPSTKTTKIKPSNIHI